jgi:hypothetical protein
VIPNKVQTRRSVRPIIGGKISRKKRRVPSKLAKVLVIKDHQGNLLMTGTEQQWRDWIKERKAEGEYFPGDGH